MILSKTAINQLILWSSLNFSHTPWRVNRSLYSTWISEVMLQQTTYQTIVNRYPNFIARFPSIESLASASEEEVLIAWKGLGYYRRAKNLLLAARFICEHHEGKFPLNLEQLLQIPGIGSYTANALLSIGGDLPFMAIDANIERVFARIFARKGAKKSDIHRELTLSPPAALLSFSPRAFNESLMDLGREVCAARWAKCSECPLKLDCLTYSSNTDPLSIPLAEAKKIQQKIVLIRFLVHEELKLLFYQKTQGEWLAGQWELPTFTLDHPLTKQYPLFSSEQNHLLISPPILSLKSNITHHEFQNRIYSISRQDFINHGLHDHFSQHATQFLTTTANPLALNLSSVTLKILKAIKGV
ncbi:MAG: A/G-specific adenine glycosylase [Oligoflexia bacterium]|nr:A/G-specific adenine glycosylase [Oligoflexia bacterium]MBF0365577.1 A/G-specific adenine glycosylase [Oligoflexia bacterium]